MAKEARIFQPAKTAMQSGHAKNRGWAIAFKPSRQDIDGLMGWPSSQEMDRELHLTFPQLEEAIAYAQKQHYVYTVEKQKAAVIHPKSYGDNFKGRIR